MAVEKVRTICFECHSRCGCHVEVDNGRIVGIKGDKAHPHSHGYLCPKGRACAEIVYHPERITKPLLRVGDRNSGRFEEASWDKALDVVAENLLAAKEKHGPESVVFGSGTTRGLAPYLNRFLALFGSPNFMAPSNMSGGPIVVGSAATMGFTMVDPDYANAKCILLWAHNPEASWPGLYMYDINQGLKNGAKLIVVDPRGTNLAKKADHWLPIRPGTDVALALCFMNVIIEENLHDAQFCEQWCNGFDKLVEHVREFTPEKVSEITWVPAEDIRAAARAFGETRPAAVGPGMGGVCQQNDAFALCRSLTILSAITGNLAVPGGNLQCSPPTRKRSCYGPDFDAFLNLPPEQGNKKLGLDRFPLLRFIPIPSPPQAVWPAIEEGKPYPVAAMGLFANNSVCAYPNSPRVHKALSSLDFLLCVDYFHTPTTALADVILPPAHWSERDDVEDLLMQNHVMAQVAAVDPVPECRDEKQILIDLAAKVGLEGYWKTVEEILDYRLEPLGTTWDEFKKKGVHFNPVVHKLYEKKGGFRTPSGKVEVYADYLEAMGIAPLPVYREPDEGPVASPDLYEEYPLILTTGGRNLVYYHSSHRNIPSLRKKAPDPELQIHPDTAQTMGVEDGEWVKLATPRGHVEIKAKYYDDVHPRVVHSPHGFWYGVENGWRRVNVNMITADEPLCPVTGSVPIKALLCRVEKMQ
ncbi:MAG: molybdopterin-dependent oxidoreductase [Desulfatibacillaceae bacterium]